MAEDWFINAVSDVERAAERAQAAIGAAREALAPARLDRETGVPLPSIAQRLALRGGEARRLAAAAYGDYEQAVHTFRSLVIRALVDDEGLTVTELARGMDVSRQMVTRLYEAGRQYHVREHT